MGGGRETTTYETRVGKIFTNDGIKDRCAALQKVNNSMQSAEIVLTHHQEAKMKAREVCGLNITVV